MKYLLLPFFLFAFAATSHAQHRNRSEAMDIAHKTLKTNCISVVNFNDSDKVSAEVKTKSIPDDEDYPFYIFNDTVSNSFVIVSSDSRMKDVLGISYNGSFYADDIPCGLKGLLDDYYHQYESLSPLKSSNQQQPATKEYEDKAPLLTSQWGQSSPYNDKSPGGCPCGCVATAMSQIMYFHKYPLHGSGSFSYTSRTHSYTSSFNYSSTTFDWENMKDKYDAYSSSKSNDAVATLVDACGVSVGMDYDSRGSGAYGIDIPYAIRTYFNYNDNVAYLDRTYYSNSDWYDLVHSELDASHPILYCGSDLRQGGHAFVIDGYDSSNGAFHVNWGWDGKYDGYYELDILDPGSYEFSASQSMIAGFSPETSDSENDIFYADAFYCNQDNGDMEDEISFSIENIYNLSNTTSYINKNTAFTGTIGIGLYDSAMNFVAILDSISVKSLHMLDGYDNLEFECRLDWSKLDKTATYYVCPTVKKKSSVNYTRIRTRGGKYDCYTLKYDDHGGETPIYDSILAEGLNSTDFPSTWKQVSVQGAGSWKPMLVLTESEDEKTPIPYEGKGYIYTEYNSGSIFGNAPTVTRITLPKLNATADLQYRLSFACRKYSTSGGDNPIIGIYIAKGDGSRIKLSEETIQGSTGWSLIEIPYTVSGNYNIVLESSIEKEGRLFIDNLKVSKAEITKIKKYKVNNADNSLPVYNILGFKVDGNSLVPGHVYIVDGKKVLWK